MISVTMKAGVMTAKNYNHRNNLHFKYIKTATVNCNYISQPCGFNQI